MRFVYRTLTRDQGGEIARHQDLADLAKIDGYIAEPHSLWKRPINENGNCPIRRYVSKGTNLNQFKPQHLRTIEHRNNTIPRRSLNWATAETVYNRAATMTG